MVRHACFGMLRHFYGVCRYNTRRRICITYTEEDDNKVSTCNHAIVKLHNYEIAVIWTFMKSYELPSSSLSSSVGGSAERKLHYLITYLFMSIHTGSTEQ